MNDNDREQKLRRLAAANSYWAEEELHLIEIIRQYKKRLAELPDIICRLNEERERVTAEMNRTGAEHDALEAEGDDAEFRRWAEDDMDDYSDFLLTTQPPRPNPLGLFKEPR